MAVSALTPGSATAGWDVANAAYERGDYQTAFHELVPLAIAGDPLAQVNIGLMYASGQGVPENYAEALRWYRMAAAQGEALAQVKLVQAKLAALAYDPGLADSVLGQRTRAAIRAFQADVGLPVDAEISDQLIAALSDAGANGRSAAAHTAAADLGSEGTDAKPWERRTAQVLRFPRQRK